ncbi:unnamed protein product [Closterium sp. NIES-54]
MTTLQVLLHVAAQRDYELHSLDFSTAFLQGSLHEEIWMRRPPGFTGSFSACTQWSLRQPVYGLRQAPREWHDTLRLAALGFAPSSADLSLFLRTDTTLPLFYVLVYVDDLVFATADTEALAVMKAELQERHTCTDLGELHSYLGLQITRDRARHTITLTQSHMVHQVLQRFGFQFSSPQPTPLSSGRSLSAPPSDESVEPSGPYLELVGCLMYLMTCTRPDLVYPLSLLARYVAPGRHRKGSVVLTSHSDASWADDQATQHSSEGYTFSLGSGFGSWRSTRSSSVLSSSYEAEIYTGAMAAQELRWLTYLLTDLGERPHSPPVFSSCEAEIYAGAMAAQELRWLTYLLTDLGEPPRSPLVLYVDNKAMLALCREHRLEHRTKHIAPRYFLARELQQRGQLRLAYVASQANTADIFTEALQPCDHQRFCTMLARYAIWFELVFNFLSLMCSTCREALAAKDAAEELPVFDMVDDLIRTVADLLGRSGPRHARFMDLQEVITETSLEVQGIHSIWWLSRGDAVHRLVAVLPAVIVVLKELNSKMYKLTSSYRFHFFLYFLADVLEQLNILNKTFQQKQIKQTTHHIESRYVDCGDDFGGGMSQWLSPFLECHGPGCSHEVKVEGVDSDGRPSSITFTLHDEPVDSYSGPEDHDGCIKLCTEFAERIVANLEGRLDDLDSLSGVCLFTPDAWPQSKSERNAHCQEWL